MSIATDRAFSSRHRVVHRMRALASEIWHGDRPVAPFDLHGLNSEAAVRGRLQLVLRDLFALPNLPIAVTEVLRLLDPTERAPLHVLERTEDLLQHIASHHESIDALVADPNPVVRHVLRLALVQSIGGRMGHWAVRSEEIPDARIARGLYRGGVAVDWSYYTKLLARGVWCFEQRDFRGCAAMHLEADRLVRTPTGLIHIAVSLCHLGDFVGALWAIRACLVEPDAAFESARSVERARTLRQRLAALVAERQMQPMEAEEVELLGGDTHDSIRHTPKPAELAVRVEAVHRERLEQRRPSEPPGPKLTRMVVRDRWRATPVVPPRQTKPRIVETARPFPHADVALTPTPHELEIRNAVTEVEVAMIIDTAYDDEVFGPPADGAGSHATDSIEIVALPPVSDLWLHEPEDRATEELAFATLEGPQAGVLGVIADTAEILNQRGERYLETERIRTR